MRLPRRVPWAHVGELEQVCSWVCADEEDLEAKTLAINRLSAWKAMTPLPHALDSVLAILVARVLDASYRDAVSARTTLGLRQTYASAIIRMVNGLVDPLQSGAHARSIAAIATQLGLPSWLVELRHAATHEDLPSLELLREASRQSLSWLLHNYFHPTLNPSAPAPLASPSPPRPIEPLLKSYKLLMKPIIRDGSLRKQCQGKIDTVMRDIERWITETGVSAELAAHPLGWGFDDNSVASKVDIKERWPLEILCGALLEKGVIVPVSKRKCCAPADPFLPTPTSIALWSPLLMQLRVAHAAFPSIFTSRIISTLVEGLVVTNTEIDLIELDSMDPPKDALYSEYLARWVTWAARFWSDGSEDGTNLKKEIVLRISPFFILGHDSGIKFKVLNELLQAISVGSKDLLECISLLRSAAAAAPSQPWEANDLVNMTERLQILMANGHRTSEPSGNGSTLHGGGVQPGGIPAAGWRLLDNHSDWTPCPIGVYYSES